MKICKNCSAKIVIKDPKRDRRRDYCCVKCKNIRGAKRAKERWFSQKKEYRKMKSREYRNKYKNKDKKIKMPKVNPDFFNKFDNWDMLDEL